MTSAQRRATQSRPFAPGAPPAFLPADARRDGEWLRLQLADLTVTALHHAPEGPSKGAVLVVPGYTGSKEDHLELAAELAARGWDAWSYSQRGQSDSEAVRRPDGLPDPNAYTLGDFVADLLQVGDAVLARTGATDLHLVGHSFGGVVAEGAVIADPSPFASLTLMCSGVVANPDRPWDEERDAHRARIHARDTGSTALEARTVVDPRLAAPAADWDAFVEARHLAHSPESLLGITHVLQEQPDMTEDLRAAGLPIHVVHGRDDDAWDPARYEAVAAELGARFSWIEEAAHSPNREQPGATADALAAFFAAAG